MASPRRGLAVFGAVPPGDDTLKFSGKKCTVEMDAWRGDDESVARLPVLAGVRSLAGIRCE
jgi:hypothetical protein